MVVSMKYNMIKRGQLSKTWYIQHFQIILQMRAKRQRKKVEEGMNEEVMARSEQPRLFKIRFNTSQENLACFIDPSKTKREVKTFLNRPKRKPSRQQQEKILDKLTEKPVEKSLEKPKTKCQDIINEALNSVLSKIQRNGITCAWPDPVSHPTQSTQTEDELQEQTSKIWSDSFSSKIDEPVKSNYVSDMQYYNPLAFYVPYYKVDYRCDDTTMFTVLPSSIGMDPRTTIMIRNIPNKYTIKELGDEINTQLANTYDFLYLPCDTRNQCNVGYGFINFLNTEYLREFYDLFNNHKWARYRSDKICVLTYARLQGLDSLIDHFENSKVLNQKDKKYRPIINKESRTHTQQHA